MTKGKYVFAALLVAFALVVLWKYITNPWLWFDEAGQFWMSKGLNHQSAPNSGQQGLWQVIVNNRHHNMDPGGYSVLLYFWLMISNHYVFVRFFSLLFFIGFAICFYKYLSIYTKNTFFSFICAVLLFVFPLTMSRMVEVRAYTMEMMGILWAMLLLHKCKNSNYSPKSLLFLSLSMAFFCTSRYEYVAFAFVIGVYTFINILKTKSLIWKKLVAFCLPLLFGVLVIIAIMLQYQNPSLRKMEYLKYLSDSPSLFFERYFLLYLLNTVIVLVSYFKNRRITQLQTVSLMVSTMFVILSLLGKYPWDNIRTISVAIVLYLNLANEVYQHVNLKKMSFLNDYIKIFLVMVIWHFHYGVIAFPGGSHKEEYESLKFAVNQKESKVIYLDYWFAPSVKYAYEYGAEKDRVKIDNYPDSFRFQYLYDRQTGKRISTMPKQIEADYYLLFKANDFSEDISILGLNKVYRWVYAKNNKEQ